MAVIHRRKVLHGEDVRSVKGDDIAPGDVLATGVVLDVTRNEIDGESRLEMAGNNVHFVGDKESVAVLASLDEFALALVLEQVAQTRRS